MSHRELTRCEVVKAVLARRLTQGEAAARLALSVRQVKRLVHAYRNAGARGLLSRRRGHPSNRRIAAAEQTRCIDLVRQRYADFGPTLAAEYLAAQHGYAHSVETLRGWMIAAGLWQPAKGVRQRPHPPRERRARRGELVQIDGSPHDWFERRGPRCCLIAFIDDATSCLMYARFVPVESTRAYLEALGAYVARFGVPVACYSDRHSIFTKHDPEDPRPTQFERALRELGCEPIQATTPQAKGRIERVFQTLQDRLVKAMRLADIADIAAANAFLTHHLATHNARFAVAARDDRDAHRPFRPGLEALARVCALHHERTLSKDLVLSFRGQRHIVLVEPLRPRYALRHQKVIVCEHLDGRIELLHGNHALPYRAFDPSRELRESADDKTLNDRVDRVVQRLEAHKPPKNHPWRRPIVARASSPPST